MFGKKSLEVRLAAIGGTIRQLLQAAKDTVSQSDELSVEVEIERQRLADIRTELDGIKRLAEKLVELSE